MAAYLAVQREARRELAGLWGNQAIASRAVSLQALWDEQRRLAEQKP